MPVKQDNRLITVSASFIKNDTIATDVLVTESFSAPFSIDLTLLSENHDLSSKDVIGQKCSVQLNYKDTKNPRFFHGRVNRLLLGNIDGDLRRYKLCLVPGFWFSTQSKNHRIYDKKSALEIITSILKGYGDFCVLADKTKATYLKREYCVQYNESDFDFVSRLMEEEGISYYFLHTDKKHEMVLCDSTSGYSDCADKKAIMNVGSNQDSDATILSWQRELQYHTGGFELTDFNHDTPKNFYKQSLTTKNTFAQKPEHTTMQEFSEFNFTEKSEAVHDFDVNANKQLTQVRLEAFEATHDQAFGTGFNGSFFAGGRFTLEHHIASESNSYVITQIIHAASDGMDQDSSYSNDFKCIPDTVIFRTPQDAVKNTMRGPLTAKVVQLNASDSKDTADPHRMIKVEFPWAAKAKTCWLRVAQSYAGSGWGASFVPRLNQEVLVDFINGDPDRPIVIGALYNKDNQGPAYTSTQSGFKTASDKYNEFRFDDKKGEEEIFVEAGKNYNFIIHNDESGEIENDQTLTVKNNRAITVSDGDETKTISKGNQSLEVGGDQSFTVKGAQKIAVTGGIKHDSKQSIEMKGAQSIKLQANVSIELKVGGNSIKIDPSGITITGTMVKINGSAMTEVKGGGMLKMQGGLVMIN